MHCYSAPLFMSFKLPFHFWFWFKLWFFLALSAAYVRHQIRIRLQQEISIFVYLYAYLIPTYLFTLWVELWDEWVKSKRKNKKKKCEPFSNFIPMMMILWLFWQDLVASRLFLLSCRISYLPLQKKCINNIYNLRRRKNIAKYVKEFFFCFYS